MEQHLVVWGDIGTDHKALVTIELKEEERKVIFHAFPQEIVTKDIQDQLFTIWKNGGEFEFPEGILTWEVPSDKENLLPEEITLHKPGILVNAQRLWQKKVMLKNNVLLFQEKLTVLHLELDSQKNFNKELWNKTKSLWDEILASAKQSMLLKHDVDSLKSGINKLFDGLKAFKRINHEKGFEESNSLFKLFNLRVDECTQKLVYPDEWNAIFEQLKVIQKEMNDANLTFKHKRVLYNKINGVFKDLRNYKNANYLNHLKERVNGLKKVISGIQKDILLDEENYVSQCDKMKHYTRGKMTDEEIEAQFLYLKERAVSKNKKVKSIDKTIQSLLKKIEKVENEPDEQRPAKKKRGKKKKKAANSEENPASKQEVAKEVKASKSEEKTVDKPETTKAVKVSNPDDKIATTKAVIASEPKAKPADKPETIKEVKPNEPIKADKPVEISKNKIEEVKLAQQEKLNETVKDIAETTKDNTTETDESLKA